MTRRPPGPKALFGLKTLRESTQDFLRFYSQCARTYGDITFIQYMTMPFVFVNHPEYIESVLVTQYQKFHKSFDYKALRPFVGNGLLTSEGDFWRRQRRLAQPGFHRERMAAYSDLMAESAELMLSQWRDGETREIHQDMMGVTLDIVAKCLFRADVRHVAHVVAEAMHVAMFQIAAQAKHGYLIPFWFPTPGNLRYRRAVTRMDKIIYGVIDDHRTHGASPTGLCDMDLLGMLLAARDDDGQPMTSRQLRDEVMTLFLAGHETTANALTWTLYLLSQNPEVETKLCEELDRVLGGRNPSLSDLPQLRYTSMVVKEGLRLYPPAWGLGRQAAEPFELGGYQFEKGTYVMLCQYIMHRDARFFPDPERFYPDRWTEDFAPRFAYFPFGAGPRVCVGAAFANMETTLLMAAIAQKFRMRLEPGHRVVPLTSVTLRPKYGMRMQVQARDTRRQPLIYQAEEVRG